MTFTVLTLAAALQAGDLPSTLAAGDAAFEAIDYRRAIALYESELAANGRDAGLLWRLARAYVCMGESSGVPETPEAFASALEYARRCVAADSLSWEGHTWLAASLGYLALHESVGKQVSLSRELYREAVRAIELNPGNDAAYSILGSFYRALGNVGWIQRSLASVFLGSIPPGGRAEAESALKTAVALAPDVMRHQYELGVLYIDMGREDEARAALHAALELPAKTAIDRPRRVRARELLEQLGPGK
jgi:tetratricopeptide (TPR) repeat protein